MFSSSSPPASFLTVPPEIRLKIFALLFHTSPIKVEAQSQSLNSDYEDLSSASTPGVYMSPISLSSQLLRTNKEIYAEALPVLYSSNTFDCSSRSAIQLLMSTIPDSSFRQITSLMLDWEQLQDFSFLLAKPDFVELTSNITTISLAHWRTRVLGGSSFLWRDVQANERTICQSAQAITQKSARLRMVAQRPWVRPSKQVSSTAYHFNPENARNAAKVDENLKEIKQASSSIRIKWRFLADQSQMVPEESLVQLDEELKVLLKRKVAKDEGSVQMALDPA